jgi:hypothetical protein
VKKKRKWYPLGAVWRPSDIMFLSSSPVITTRLRLSAQNNGWTGAES